MHYLPPGCVEQCPACPHRGFSPDESHQRKQQWLMKRLPEFADSIQPIRGVNDHLRWHYRNKVCLAAAYMHHKWDVGVRKRDTVIAIPQCPVHHESVNRNIALLCSKIPPPEKFPLAYFMQSGAQVTLILKSRNLPDMDWLDEELRESLEHQGVEGFWIHLHPSAGRKIIGKGGWHLIFGKHRSISKQGMYYGPASFAQVLPELHLNSMQLASDFLSPDSKTYLVDLYCGIGSTLAQWIRAGSDCVGVELGSEAIECAALNAPRAIVLRGTCAQRIPQLNALAAQAIEQGKTILLYANPPRTGLEEEVRQWIATSLKPARFVYLSCSAGTLHRDLQVLTQQGYRVIQITPYDFFPQTLHLEMLVLVERVK